uniref:Uncharacterized protein n=1 Tax=Arundo donax TaxID=35708 RepID=A0A0A9FE89_ARUDO
MRAWLLTTTSQCISLQKSLDWTGLYGADMQAKILEGVKIMVQVAYTAVKPQPATPLLLKGPDDDPDEEAET